jgi:iron complex transport system ATP-binding protein
MENLLRVNNLYGGYGAELVVRDISLEIKKGEFIGVIGPNGSGKSTLLRLMSRALLPQAGRVSFSGQDINQMGGKAFARQVAFVSQDTRINFSFSVWEIVLMGRIPHLKRMQSETKGDAEIAARALSFTDTLKIREKGIDEISAGERQRVLIAKALAQEPVLLFLDEPTSHLDIAHQVQIMDLLKRLNRQNRLTIIIVLHDLNLASEYCSRIILFDQGRIFKDGTPEDVLTYQNIESVYKTVVIVNKNPLSSKPYVALVSQEK